MRRVAAIVITIACVMVGAVTYSAQVLENADKGDEPAAQTSKPPAPLTEVQKLQLQNVLQRLQITQLQKRLADTEAERAQQEAQRLIQSFTREGWDLDLDTGTYRKPAEKK